MIKNVMLIDDNKIDVFVNQRVIEKYDPNIRITAYNDAESALNFFELYEANVHSVVTPEIILLDINMPRMDGFSFFDRFKTMKRTSENEITVFMLSSSSCPDDLKKAKREPLCAGYIIKPLTMDKLRNAVEEVRNLKDAQEFKKII